MTNRLTDTIRFQLQKYLERKQTELERGGKIDLERLAQDAQTKLVIPITPANIRGALRVIGYAPHHRRSFPDIAGVERKLAEHEQVLRKLCQELGYPWPE